SPRETIAARSPSRFCACWLAFVDARFASLFKSVKHNRHRFKKKRRGRWVLPALRTAAARAHGLARAAVRQRLGRPRPRARRATRAAVRRTHRPYHYECFWGERRAPETNTAGGRPPRRNDPHRLLLPK